MILWSYNVHPSQVLGGPGRIGTDKYDIVAKPVGGGLMDAERIESMLRTLMADRFQLKLHHETKELPIYALTIGKNGPKMKARTEGDGGAPSSLLIGGPRWPVRNAPMALVVTVLQMVVLDRPVLDKTGLTGNFDFDLVWTPDETQFGGRGSSMPADPNAPNIFTAFQEQLGLKLEPQKVPSMCWLSMVWSGRGRIKRHTRDLHARGAASEDGGIGRLPIVAVGGGAIGRGLR